MGREIAGLPCFLACLPQDAPGTAYFPSQAVVDSSFLSHHPEGVRPANPIVYFIVHNPVVGAGEIAWEYPPTFFIDQVFTPDSQTVSLLLEDTMRIDLRLEAGESISVRTSVAGDLAAVLEERAAARGQAASALVAEFMADSVFTLAAAQEGLRLTGDFHDAREPLPKAGVGR